MYNIYIFFNRKEQKAYIGRTKKEIIERFLEHAKASHYGSNTKFHIALRRFGIKDFELGKICECETLSQAKKLEEIFIKRFDSVKEGYNILSGGYKDFDELRFSRKRTDYSIEDISFIVFKKKKEIEYARVPWNKGLKGVQEVWNKGLTANKDSRVANNVKNMNSTASNWSEEKRKAKSEAMKENDNGNFKQKSIEFKLAKEKEPTIKWQDFLSSYKKSA